MKKQYIFYSLPSHDICSSSSGSSRVVTFEFINVTDVIKENPWEIPIPKALLKVIPTAKN